MCNEKGGEKWNLMKERKITELCNILITDKSCFRPITLGCWVSKYNSRKDLLDIYYFTLRQEEMNHVYISSRHILHLVYIQTPLYTQGYISKTFPFTFQ